MKKRKESMKKNNLNEINYPLTLREDELSILGSALQYCLFETNEYICCENCRIKGVEVLEMIFELFMKKT